MADDDKLNSVRFYLEPNPPRNEGKSREAGRPVHDEPRELCEVRSAGDRNSIKVFPAHAFARWITTQQGDQEQQTYAQRWPEQYRRFKEGRQQIAEGTPLEELTFLNAARRSELKALAIYTAEAILALDGQNLKTLGMWGRELKAQTQAYMDKANGSANVTAMAAQIASLQETIAGLQADAKPAATGKST